MQGANWCSFSNHARRRSQQRAISLVQIDFVLSYGEWFHDRGGSMTAWVGKRLAGRLPRHVERAMQDCLGVAVSVASDGAIVTVQRAARPKRAWRGGR